MFPMPDITSCSISTTAIGPFALAIFTSAASGLSPFSGSGPSRLSSAAHFASSYTLQSVGPRSSTHSTSAGAMFSVPSSSR